MCLKYKWMQKSARMKTRYSIVIVIIGLHFVIKSVRANSTDLQSVLANSHQPYFPGELLVKFREEVSLKDTTPIHSHFGVTKIREGYNGCYQIIEVPSGKEKEIAEAYSKRHEVEYAELNYYRHINAKPNDMYYRLQWNFPLIHLPEAWDLSTGDGVTVAVVDTGVNPFGIDGFGKLFNNRVLMGYNAILGIPGGIDFNGHGTHVAGTIGQETNNWVGVAGIAYDAKILPVKVLCFLGEGLDSWIIDGIRWATEHGADIINLSLGGSPPSKAFEGALKYAYQHGVTLVAASGNGGDDHVGDPQVDYPASSEYCIAVGAVQYDKEKTYYSNYGEGLDLVAPGGDKNIDQNGDGYVDGILQETFWFLGIGWGYWYYTGTSMASPHVAGVAALVKSLAPDYYGPDEIRQVLQETAEDLGDPGWDETYGYGLVDAYAAVSYQLPSR